MSRIIRSALILGIFSILALISIGYGYYQWQTAKAARHSLVFGFDKSEKIYSDLDGYLGKSDWVPLIFQNWQKEVSVNLTKNYYWQRRYSDVLDLEDENLNDVSSQELFIRANAEYRKIEAEKNKTLVIEGLERSASGYLQAINRDPNHFDGSFNYEYIIKTRDEVASGKRPLPLKKGQENKPGSDGKSDSESESKMFGEEGSPSGGDLKTTIKIFTPLNEDESVEPGGNDAGKGDEKRRKG